MVHLILRASFVPHLLDPTAAFPSLQCPGGIHSLDDCTNKFGIGIETGHYVVFRSFADDDDEYADEAMQLALFPLPMMEIACRAAIMPSHRPKVYIAVHLRHHHRIYSMHMRRPVYVRTLDISSSEHCQQQNLELDVRPNENRTQSQITRSTEPAFFPTCVCCVCACLPPSQQQPSTVRPSSN